MLKDALLKFFKLDGIASNLTGYVETRIELLKIEIKEDIARGLSKASIVIVLIFAFSLFTFFASMALAYKIGEYWGVASGFAVVGGIYLLIALSLVFMRESITAMIEKQVLNITKKKK